MKSRSVVSVTVFFADDDAWCDARRKRGGFQGYAGVCSSPGKTKHTLLDSVRQVSRGGAVPISAKFELEDGKLSLSVYTAGKGLSVAPERTCFRS